NGAGRRAEARRKVSPREVVGVLPERERNAGDRALGGRRAETAALRLRLRASGLAPDRRGGTPARPGYGRAGRGRPTPGRGIRAVACRHPFSPLRRRLPKPVLGDR